MRKLLILVSFLMMISLLMACDTNDRNGDGSEPNYAWFDRNFFDVFDSIINVRVYFEEGSNPLPIFETIDTILWDVHRVSTKYDLYDGVINIKYLNENPGVYHTVDPMIIEMIELSMEIYENPLTQQMFNISLGSVLAVWSEYRNRCLNEAICELPSQEALETAGQFIDPKLISIRHETSEIMIPEGMKLDLGGIAKGYGAHRVAEYLRSIEPKAFVVNAGTSNIEFFGSNPHPERDHWAIGLTNPFYDPQKDSPHLSSYAVVRLEGGWNTVTSGDYERYYKVDGVEYHHIINPHTFYPTFHTRAVTVLTKDPVLGDILSTVVFLLEIDDALTLINSLDDIEMILIDRHGVVHFSDNLEANHLVELRVD